MDKETHKVSELKEQRVSQLLRGFNDARNAMKELGRNLSRLSDLSTSEFDAMNNRVVRSYADEEDTGFQFNLPGPQTLQTDNPDKAKSELFDLAKKVGGDVIEVDLKGLKDSKALERGLWGENHEMVIFENFDQASTRVQNKLSRIAKENDYSPWFLLAEPEAKPVKGFGN